MIVLIAITIAAFIVSGQALWKAAVTDLPDGTKLTSLSAVISLVMSYKLIIGVAVYAVATLLYIYFLGKYNYFQLQSIVVGSSLVLTLLLAIIIFNERPSALNIVGVLLIIVGSILVTTR